MQVFAKKHKTDTQYMRIERIISQRKQQQPSSKMNYINRTFQIYMKMNGEGAVRCDATAQAFKHFEDNEYFHVCKGV